eukprot:COSAG01_NODE_4111_length_5339_cov_13.132443_4_plen_48_part_00
MPSSSGAERCLLAPRNINDSNGDNELTWCYRCCEALSGKAGHGTRRL